MAKAESEPRENLFRELLGRSIQVHTSPISCRRHSLLKKKSTAQQLCFAIFFSKPVNLAKSTTKFPSHAHAELVLLILIKRFS